MIPMRHTLDGLELSAIRQYTNLAKQTPSCVLLTLGEPDFDTPQAIKAAAWEALQAGHTHYAPNQGLESLRQAVAQWETNRGYACTKEQVLITQGATGALYTALTGILNPGDEVIIPMPAFPLYESIVAAAGAKVVKLETAHAGFQISEAALRKAVTPRTKAIVLNSPNNPTGVVYTQESLEAVKRTVLGRPILLICDNVYTQLADTCCPDLSLDAQLQDQVIVCQSFSKPYAMTGWRVGYLAAPSAVTEKLLPFYAIQVTSVPTFLQEACVAALETEISYMAESYARRRGYVCRRLEAMGLSFPTPQGALYVFPDVSQLGMDSATLCTRLIREAGVAVVPGSCFGAEGHIRISCCCSQEALEIGLDRLEQFLKGL